MIHGLIMAKKITKEEWVARFKKVHGDKYDYSLMEYAGAHTPVKIICPIHGIFKQSPINHLNCDCKKCGAEKAAKKTRKSLDSYIKEVNKIHNNKYDYSLVEYKNVQSKIKIICPIHGVFEQRAGNHLRGEACPQCSGTKKLTKEDFIKKAREAHGDKYDYSLVEYENSRSLVKIICPIHGVFEQRAHGHSKGYGCRECGKVKDKKKKGPIRKTQEQFLKDVREVHGNKYDYSLVRYVTAKGKIKITCKEHGVFEQVAGNHLRGDGCPYCNGGTRSTLEDFIKKAREVHGDKYDYSLVEYKNNSTAVKIICKVHGVFEQAPMKHLSGNGCKYCASNLTTTKESFIKKSVIVHEGKYDYGLIKDSDISNNLSIVKIICKEHGVFEQKVYSHLVGAGCPNCATNKRAEKTRKTSEYFIKKAKEAHGDKYDYSLVEYKATSKPVKIICQKHGVFEQRPYSHFRGSGCLRCSLEKTSSKGEVEWLDHLGIPQKNRQIKINFGKGFYIVDGLVDNTVYEYYGDYWHGAEYLEEKNKNNKTFQENKTKTLQRERELKNLGYNLVTIWESDWNHYKENYL